jgi:hypothetical protein
VSGYFHTLATSLQLCVSVCACMWGRREPLVYFGKKLDGPHIWSGHYGGTPQLVWTFGGAPQLIWTLWSGPTVGLDTSEGPHSWSGHFGGAPQLVWTFRRGPTVGLDTSEKKKDLSRCRYRKNKSFSLGSILDREKIIFSPPIIQYSGRCIMQHTKVVRSAHVTVLQCLSAVAVRIVTTQQRYCELFLWPWKAGELCCNFALPIVQNLASSFLLNRSPAVTPATHICNS